MFLPIFPLPFSSVPDMYHLRIWMGPRDDCAIAVQSSEYLHLICKYFVCLLNYVYFNMTLSDQLTLKAINFLKIFFFDKLLTLILSMFINCCLCTTNYILSVFHVFVFIHIQFLMNTYLHSCVVFTITEIFVFLFKSEEKLNLFISQGF